MKKIVICSRNSKSRSNNFCRNNHSTMVIKEVINIMRNIIQLMKRYLLIIINNHLVGKSMIIHCLIAQHQHIPYHLVAGQPVQLLQLKQVAIQALAQTTTQISNAYPMVPPSVASMDNASTGKNSTTLKATPKSQVEILKSIWTTLIILCCLSIPISSTMKAITKKKKNMN